VVLLEPLYPPQGRGSRSCRELTVVERIAKLFPRGILRARRFAPVRQLQMLGIVVAVARNRSRLLSGIDGVVQYFGRGF